MTKEDLEQIRSLMKEEIKPINERLDKIENRLDKIESDIEEIKEDAKATRTTTNEIGRWVELNSTPSNPYPVDKYKAI